MDPRTLDSLAAAMSRGELRHDQATRVAYGYDNSRLTAMPGAVAFPHHADEVAALVLLCHEHRIPVTARGLGSATTGAAVPMTDGLVIALERMNRIVALAADDRYMICEPGVLNADVQCAAAEVGLFWAPDPTSSPYSSIGGNIACNAAGPRAVKYGTPRDNVLGLRAVTGDGRALRTGTRTTKGVVGYDLTRLLIGSEGTLAIITEATLKLTPVAPARATLRACYRDAAAATRAVADIMAGPVVPCALEFMDATSVALVRHDAGIELPAGTGALLLVECDGDEGRVSADAAALATLADNFGALEVRHTRDGAESSALWACRRALSPAQRRLKPVKINEDVVVPVSRLPDLVAGLERLADTHEVTVVCFGHAGNGNLHVNLLGDAHDRKRLDSCLGEVIELVLSLDGTLSGEHGIGSVKRALVERELDGVSLDLMRSLKRVFDPHGILNPGKVFEGD